MNDCPNAEIRDLLPDLLHERLDGDRRAAVLAHVAECGDCRAELDLLRALGGVMLRATPRVDVAAIVSRLPAPQPAARALRPARRRFASWQLAAAVTLLVVGGSSVLTLSHRLPGTGTVIGTGETSAVPGAVRQGVAVVPRMPVQTPVAPVVAAPAEPSRPAAAKASPELGVNGQFADLDEADLRTLLADLDDLEPVPAAEPEPLGLNPPVLTPEDQR